jgi:mannan endo-1,4-beta-mannosidase
MKSRLVMLMSLAVAALSVVLAANNFSYRLTPVTPAHAKLSSAPGSYLGVYESATPSGYPQIQAFGQVAGRQPNLAGYISGWAEPFGGAFAATLYSHGITPLIQIDPTDASITAIASGTYDQYLRSFADSVRSFRHAVVIGFGQEMNAPWFPWGYGHVSSQTFVAAWRHLVTVFRQQGADNVYWLWTLQADQAGTGAIQNWWPGSAYVSWVGIDGFYSKPSDTFASVFGKTISQARALTTKPKPVLLAETAVGPQANQFANIINLFVGARRANVLGLVWYDIAQRGGTAPEDWRIESGSTAEYAFRLGVKHLFGSSG